MWKHWLLCKAHNEWILLTVQTPEDGHLIQPWNAEYFKGLVCAFMECHASCALSIVREEEQRSGIPTIKPLPTDFVAGKRYKALASSKSSAWYILALQGH
jgi:hypothetical protein